MLPTGDLRIRLIFHPERTVCAQNYLSESEKFRDIRKILFHSAGNVLDEAATGVFALILKLVHFPRLKTSDEPSPFEKFVKFGSIILPG